MVEKNKQVVKDNKTLEKSIINLKPIQELKSFDFTASDALVCDMETGICGPVNQEKEKK